MHFALKWWWGWVILSSVQSLSHVWLFATPWTAAHLSITNSWSMQWWHPTISTSVIPFTSYIQSSPASWSFPKSQFFESGGQNIGASASVLPVNIQDWFPLGLTGLISLLSKGLSRVFSNTTVQKYQFFSAQLSSWFNSHIHSFWLYGPLLAK